MKVQTNKETTYCKRCGKKLEPGTANYNHGEPYCMECYDYMWLMVWDNEGDE